MQWTRGREVSEWLLEQTRSETGAAYQPVHGDPILRGLSDYDLLCYFAYTLSSWWEIPLIDRINAEREDNNFAILMDINPAPETMYRLTVRERSAPEVRYKAGLQTIFPGLDSAVTDAMYNLIRNGFGHNLFGREPGKVRFDNAYDCPPVIDRDNALLVPPVKLALSMITAFVSRISMLLLYPTRDSMRIFKQYMAEPA